MHETFPAKRHEIRLCSAPAGKRLGPFACPSEIEKRKAAVDHGAVRDADADRRHIADRDGDHDLVEQCRGRAAVPAPRHHLGKTQSAEDLKFRIVETTRQFDRL